MRPYSLFSGYYNVQLVGWRLHGAYARSVRIALAVASTRLFWSASWAVESGPTTAIRFATADIECSVSTTLCNLQLDIFLFFAQPN